MSILYDCKSNFLLGCYVKAGSGKPSHMTYGCPCSSGMTCIGSGTFDIPLGEIGI